MHSTTAFLKQLERLWRNEPQRRKMPGIFYLTPEQRVAIVKDLLYPLNDRPSR